MKSQARAHKKYEQNVKEQQSEAVYQFKVAQEFAPAPKNVPVAMAYDRKPAGNKLFQGVINQKKPGLPRYPKSKRDTTSRADPHDIFKMPASLGGGKGASKSQYSQGLPMQRGL